MKSGCPILRDFAKGGHRGCSSGLKTFPPFPYRKNPRVPHSRRGFFVGFALRRRQSDRCAHILWTQWKKKWNQENRSTVETSFFLLRMKLSRRRVTDARSILRQNATK